MLAAIEGLTRIAFSEEINNKFGQRKEKLFETEEPGILRVKAGIKFSSPVFLIHLARKAFLLKQVLKFSD